ncbi:MAG: peptide chain release factor 1 [Defluviitaleaceae bacterium]|nr:peptide chain release factor 1 [Defluviitaleaceae bacterium]
MFENLNELEKKFDILSEKINDSQVISNNSEWRALMKEHSHFSPIIEKYREYKDLLLEISENKEMLNIEKDEDFRQMIKEDLKMAVEKEERLLHELKILLLPVDENDHKNVIVEIRGGAGGDEAAIFAGNLFRMYHRYAERKRFKTEIMNTNESDVGGFKEVVFMIQGKGAYSRLKYESGVHRVQRVPATESSGRIHTSTVTVAVLPEAEDVEVEINQNDIRVDVFRSGGNGGQSVNTTDSAVRITHMPSGIVVSCQDEKSQLKNKEKAMKVLRAKLFELEQEKRQKEMSDQRKSQVGTGDRSQKIRTYNFPQGRVTDHRINLTLHRLDSVLDGDLDEIMDTLITTDQTEKLGALSEV